MDPMDVSSMSSPTPARGRPRRKTSAQKRKLLADKVRKRTNLRQGLRKRALLESTIGKTNCERWTSLRDTAVLTCSVHDKDESFAELLLDR